MKAKWFYILSFVLVFAVAFSAVAPVSAQPSLRSIKAEKSPSGVYIIQMAEDPAITYEGNIPGYRRPDQVTARRSIRIMLR